MPGKKKEKKEQLSCYYVSKHYTQILTNALYASKTSTVTSKQFQTS